MNTLAGNSIFQTPHLQEPLKKFFTSNNNHNSSRKMTTEDTTDDDKNLNSIWTKGSFLSNAADLKLDLKVTKTSWCNETKDDENEDAGKAVKNESNSDSPSHHARRPMNAFLIFCKKHRPVVREKFPALENRGVTRILGEWWAQLDISDKEPYTTLAKEYKDAFLSANPNFKWYKLPAPPLRTLYQRPASISKAISPPSPIKLASPTTEAEFNPGKLADESQLGSITSLMNMNGFNNNNNYGKCVEDKEITLNNNNNNTNNNNEDCVQAALFNSPTAPIKPPSLPPKPIKKRINDSYNGDNNNKAVARNIFDTSPEDSREHDEHEDNDSDNSMTQQELLNKVVDSMFSDNPDVSKETRKSGRSCKGKRYAKFMVEGKLLGNKKEKLTQQRSIDLNQKFESELSKLEGLNKPETPKLDLGNTIKRLAERTQVKIDEADEPERNSTNASDDFAAKSPRSDFNLDEKIGNLPSLSYETYIRRKRESKKRKSHAKTDTAKLKAEEQKSEAVGSKKRKNKLSITHLDPLNKPVDSNDLSGLATLAEVAANTERIN